VLLFLLYVDDILIASKNIKNKVKEFKKKLTSKFEIKDHGPVS